MKLSRRSLLTSLFSLPLLKHLPMAERFTASDVARWFNVPVGLLTHNQVKALPTTPVDISLHLFRPEEAIEVMNRRLRTRRERQSPDPIS